MAKKLFAETLRDAIRNADVSCYRISAETGISQSQLSKFLSKTIGLSQEKLETLIDYLDLELQPKKRKGKANG